MGIPLFNIFGENGKINDDRIESKTEINWERTIIN
jgi:hypothetical protein